MNTKTLYVVATPIGNMEDITIRAIKTLLTIPLVICEDTRHTGQLIKLLEERYQQNFPFNSPSLIKEGDRRRYISVRDWNEAGMVETVLRELESSDAALVSDAGTPLLSDPGFKIVRACVKAGIKVVPIPGAFAGVAAISGAGLPSNKVMFWGFLPKKWELPTETTSVIYESPVRTLITLEKIKERYPRAEIIVAQELTKTHETFSGYDEDFINNYKGKGEVTILVYVPSDKRGEKITSGDVHGGGNI